AVGALVRRLSLERDNARTELLQVMASPEYVALVDRLVAAAQRPRLAAGKLSSTPAKEVARQLVDKPWRRLERAASHLPEDPADTELHQFRITAKRCRYAAEAVAPVLGKPA